LRHSLGHAPFTILSCDNLPENGQVTRQSIEGLANLISPDLRDWVSEQVAYPAALLGHQYVHDAMADPDIASWLVQLMRREVIPVLQPIAGVDFDAYLETCVTRFPNPAIGDTIVRLCQDGSNRQPKFVFPTITDALAKDTDIEGLTLEVALWCLYCAQPGFVVEDARADRLSTAALASKSDPAAFLSIRDVFANDRLANAYTRQMGELWTQGPRHVIQSYLRKANE